jgi:hypothetical protein
MNNFLKYFLVDGQLFFVFYIKIFSSAITLAVDIKKNLLKFDHYTSIFIGTSRFYSY